MILVFGLGLGMLQFAGILALGSFATAAGAALALVTCAHASLRHHQTTRQLQQTCAEANQLVAVNRLDEADDLLKSAASHARLVPHMHALLIFSRGVVALLRAEIDRAGELFERAMASQWLLPTGPLAGSYPEICLWMCLAAIIRGDLEQAHRWRSQVALPGPTPPPLAAHQTLLDVLLNCRLGNFESATRAYEFGVANAEQHLSQREILALDAVAAFSLEHSRATTYRQQADQLSRWREVDGPDLNFLTVRWPELARFLGQRGIISA